MAATTSEAEIIFNRANVALARSQRLVASWLPPRTEQELLNPKSEEEIEKEEQELFKPMPELLGLGATPPQDGEAKRQEMSSNDKLRKQLLGKDLAKLYGKSQSQTETKTPFSVGSKPRPPLKRPAAEDEDEDEAGRSSIGKKTPKKRMTTSESLNTEKDAVQMQQPEDAETLKGLKQSKQPASYLDQVLTEKEKKKRKKKHRKSKDQGGIPRE